MLTRVSRSLYLIAYDIADPRRLAEVHMQPQLETCTKLASLRGLEGAAANQYFSAYARLARPVCIFMASWLSWWHTSTPKRMICGVIRCLSVA